jgi:hypothetical protein
LFEQVINDSIGRYNAFVVMNSNNETFHEALGKIDDSRLLLLDLGDFDKKGYSFVCQDFGPAVYQCLTSQKELFAKYSKAYLLFPKELEHPRITIRYFKKFCHDLRLECQVLEKTEELHIEPGCMYFLIRQKELIDLIKLCRNNSLVPGKDIGILAYNDTPVYEILENGITVISTDFSEMGRKAAHSIITREKVNEWVKTSIIVRNSL